MTEDTLNRIGVNKSKAMPKKTTKLKGFKSNLPTKICENCTRPFQYRKKWKLVWDQVKYCSDKCKKAKVNN
jgi:hypothetical protein